MSKKINQWDELKTKNPFKVPDGYFESLTAQIMSQLPEKTDEEITVVNLWDRIKPCLYMAAMFIGIALMIKIFVTPDSKELNLSSETEMEEFYQYYEDQLTNNIYREMVYLNDFE
ncbi:MAG: hypothetical protein LBG15_15290 [Dysgonamonadaceae bacterium]|jgi:hypothetical protein|nr:hypothetical protein [Dysgonamonadaceae bacterium]